MCFLKSSVDVILPPNCFLKATACFWENVLHHTDKYPQYGYMAPKQFVSHLNRSLSPLQRPRFLGIDACNCLSIKASCVFCHTNVWQNVGSLAMPVNSLLLHYFSPDWKVSSTSGSTAIKFGWHFYEAHKNPEEFWWSSDLSSIQILKVGICGLEWNVVTTTGLYETLNWLHIPFEMDF